MKCEPDSQIPELTPLNPLYYVGLAYSRCSLNACQMMHEHIEGGARGHGLVAQFLPSPPQLVRAPEKPLEYVGSEWSSQAYAPTPPTPKLHPPGAPGASGVSELRPFHNSDTFLVLTGIEITHLLSC